MSSWDEAGRLDEILSEMTSVAEGVRSCGPVLALGHKAGVELPICEQVGLVLEGRARPVEAVDALLHREASAELHDIT